MWEWLSPRLQGGAPIVSRSVHVSGLAEGIIAAPLGELQARYPDIDIGSYPFYRPSGNGVAIVAKGTDASAAEAVIEEVTKVIVGFGKVPIPGEPEGA
jgi:molybdopterin-biosynthesis enzyme MoeA-like protein